MSLYEKLFDYQQRIVDKFLGQQSLGLFLDMGLGKTILSLALAEQNKCTKVLIITINAKAIEPVEIRDSWLGWASQSSIPYKTHNKYSKDSFSFYQNDLLILNYESLFVRKKADKRTGVTLRESIYDFIDTCTNHNVAIIVDESHKMKNLQSIQTKAIFQIKRYLQLKSAKVFTYLLTGTPFTTGYVDLYSQLKMLGYNDNKQTFVDNFCVKGNLPGLLGWQQPIVGYKNIDELYNLVHKYAITIKSEDVIKLPEQVFINHTTECSKEFELYTNEKIEGHKILNEMRFRNESVSNEQLELYDTDHKRNNPYFRNIAWPDLSWLAETNGTFWLRARQISIGFQGNSEDSKFYNYNRMNEIKRFLEQNTDNYVIFYNYTPELIELFNMCDELGYNVDVYCGEIKSLENYQRYVNLSESEKLVTKGNVIIANFASGSTGLNWQQYSKVIIASTPLYKDYAQAIKRVHRPGQKNTVFYHVFYERNWLDYSMRKALEEAQDYNKEMFEADLKRIQELTQKSTE